MTSASYLASSFAGVGTSRLVAVAHVNPHAVDRELDRLGQPRIAGNIGVAVDGTHRRDQLQLVENLVAADVAGVEDQFNTGERRVNIGSNEAVRV